MKLTKQLEKEVRQIVDDYFDSYIKGDLELTASLLDEKYTQVGSAESEVFNNKKDALKFLYDTILQVENKLEMRNRSWRMDVIGESILVHDKCDLFVLNENEWMFYSKFRVSTLVHKNRGKWKIIHQHSSFPDSKTDEGGNLAIENIAAENQQLRDAVKRRTYELELKNRELEIESALERIRAKAMSMHHSYELSEVLSVLFEQYDVLGIHPIHAQLSLVDLDNNKFTYRATGKEGKRVIAEQVIDMGAIDVWRETADKWKTSMPNTVNKLYFPKEIFPQVWDLFKEIRLSIPEDARVEPEDFPDGMYITEGYCRFGYIGYAHTRPATAEEEDIVIRFANEFARLYQRFLDLQKAEAQTREVQIENALERVRTQTMSMHKCSELHAVINVINEQLQVLGFQIDGTNFATDFTDEGYNMWLATPGQPFPEQIYVPRLAYRGFHGLDEALREGKEFYTYTLTREEKNYFFNHFFENTVAKNTPREQKDFVLSSLGMAASVTILKKIIFTVLNFDGKPFSEEENAIIKRFGAVFEQSYIRFLDLQKSEAQAREAQIEVALEKVRSRTMAMQRSEELKYAATLLFQQVKVLGAPAYSCGYNIWGEGDKVFTSWMSTQDGTDLNAVTDIPLTEEANFLRFTESKKNSESFFVMEMRGERMQQHYQYLKTIPGFKAYFEYAVSAGFPLPETQIHHVANFSNGNLLFITLEPSPEFHDVFRRFAAVFDQTYTRFLDLQKAEAQTREAMIETALERVRARALAMQQPEELKDVAWVLRTEMGLLGIEELETCSIYIHEDKSPKAECWYALKDPNDDEKRIVSDHFTLDLKDTWVGQEMFKFFHSSEKKVSISMSGANRKEWIECCYKYSPMLNGFYGDNIPDRIYHLYKFSHGAIGAASSRDISLESWGLLQRAASVFSLAYSRFSDLTQARNDLQLLKEEKKRAEDALVNLKATQVQLIQAEKMASLGELTAGIAHEIQNPLNFVNNFSEVNKELIDEMEQEISKGNLEEVKAIANDIRENQKKITEHGKRADGIVKGMLQHSRSSTGSKESIDMNALADEYLRLSYHGLRAKDKLFNAKFETLPDPSLPMIEVIPQDMGRVLLNTINNAFYAVNERKKKNEKGYEPSVHVQTKANNGMLEISITDNGNGISQKILDKIFQPFFTTKPTGQGTGLGLSLSYDIVKAHGGEITVESVEKKGSTFTIHLPIFS